MNNILIFKPRHDISKISPDKYVKIAFPLKSLLGLKCQAFTLTTRITIDLTYPIKSIKTILTIAYSIIFLDGKIK